MQAASRAVYASVPLFAPVIRPVPDRATLADIVRMFRLPARFWEEGVVTVGGVAYEAAQWGRVRCKAGMVVQLSMDPAGGGDRTKNILAVIASVLLVVATAGIAAGALAPGGILGAAGFSGLAAGTVGANALAAVVGIGGQLLIGALFPPPVPKGQDADRPLNRADIQDNILAKGEQVPFVAGTMRVSPPLICQPYSYLVGDDEYAEAVYILAGPHDFTDARMRGTPVEDLDGVSITYDQGLPEEARTNVFTRHAVTAVVNTILTRHRLRGTEDGYDPEEIVDQDNPAKSLPQWHRAVIRPGANMAALRFTLSGLIDVGSPTDDQITWLRFRMRKVGDSSWTNLPQVHYRTTGNKTFRSQINIHLGNTAGETAPQVRDTNGVWGIVGNLSGSFTGIEQFRLQGGGGVWVGWAVSTSWRGYRTREGADLYLDSAYFQDRTVGYEIEVMRSMMLELDDYFGGNKAGVESQFMTPPETGVSTLIDPFDTYRASATAKWRTVDGDDDNNDTITWETIASVFFEPPLASTAPFASAQVKVKNRDFSQFSVLATGLVPSWDGEAWSGWNASANPADWYRELLAGHLAVTAIPEAYIDDAELVDWRTECASQGYEVNAIIDGSLGDAMDLVAACGYARPYEGMTFSVIWHRDRSAEDPTQVFSPRNSRGFSWNVAYSLRPAALRVSFWNAAKDYERDEIVVDDPDPIPGGSTAMDQVEYPGLTTEAQATARALFDFSQVRKAVRYSFDVGIEHIVTQRGELALLAHDAIHRHVGFARVTEVLSGTTFRIDERMESVGADGLFAVDELLGEEFVFRIGDPVVVVTRSDGATQTQSLVAWDATGLIVTVADASLVEAGDLVIWGPGEMITKRVLITDIEPSGEFEARITCMDE